MIYFEILGIRSQKHFYTRINALVNFQFWITVNQLLNYQALEELSISATPFKIMDYNITGISVGS